MIRLIQLSQSKFFTFKKAPEEQSPYRLQGLSVSVSPQNTLLDGNIGNGSVVNNNKPLKFLFFFNYPAN